MYVWYWYPPANGISSLNDGIISLADFCLALNIRTRVASK
jgi:hypothetical protein